MQSVNVLARAGILLGFVNFPIREDKLQGHN